MMLMPPPRLRRLRYELTRVAAGPYSKRMSSERYALAVALVGPPERVTKQTRGAAAMTQAAALTAP